MTSPIAADFLPPRWSRAIWDISGAFIFDREILAFHDFLQQVLSISNPIKYVHGSPALIWNSGRVTRQITPHEEHIASLQAYAQRRISVLLTASNTILNREHLNDKKSNHYCSILSQEDYPVQNGVIIGTDILNDYIRSQYPRLLRISSILKITHDRGQGKLDLYKRYLDEYDLVMLHPDDVTDPEFLALLPEPERFIALVNEYCIRQCPIRHLHYQDLSENSLHYLSHDSSNFDQMRMKNGCSNLYQLLLHPSKGTLALSHNELARLHDMGFRHFKVQGRGMVNAVPYLSDLMRLMLRTDRADEATMHGIKQLFWESYPPAKS